METLCCRTGSNQVKSVVRAGLFAHARYSAISPSKTSAAGPVM